MLEKIFYRNEPGKPVCLDLKDEPKRIFSCDSEALNEFVRWSCAKLGYESGALLHILKLAGLDNPEKFCSFDHRYSFYCTESGEEVEIYFEGQHVYLTDVNGELEYIVEPKNDTEPGKISIKLTGRIVANTNEDTFTCCFFSPECPGCIDIEYHYGHNKYVGLKMVDSAHLDEANYCMSKSKEVEAYLASLHDYTSAEELYEPIIKILVLTKKDFQRIDCLEITSGYYYGHFYGLEYGYANKTKSKIVFKNGKLSSYAFSPNDDEYIKIDIDSGRWTYVVMAMIFGTFDSESREWTWENKSNCHLIINKQSAAEYVEQIGAAAIKKVLKLIEA